jgi:hypothetical protein
LQMGTAYTAVNTLGAAHVSALNYTHSLVGEVGVK